MRTIFWLEYLKGRGALLGIIGKIILQWILGK